MTRYQLPLFYLNVLSVFLGVYNQRFAPFNVWVKENIRVFTFSGLYLFVMTFNFEFEKLLFSLTFVDRKMYKITRYYNSYSAFGQ